jgi:hypothetical protein
MVLDPTLRFFIGLILAYFLSIWHEEHIIQTAKSLTSEI